jgi:hypothetical protein
MRVTSSQPANIFFACLLLRLIETSIRIMLVCLQGGLSSGSASGNIADAKWMGFLSLTAGLEKAHLSKRADSHQVEERGISLA